MGTAAQKKKFDGMSARNAKQKVAEIFAKECQSVTFNRMNKDFTKTYSISFLAMAETWHRLRSQNKTLELIIQAFAESIARRNEKIHALDLVIRKQRDELARLNANAAVTREREAQAVENVQCGQATP